MADKVRDCNNCKHYVVAERTVYGAIRSCECWDCEYEPLLPFEEREDEQESEE